MENLDCLICLSRAVNPCMCSKCSKILCQACLQTHFQLNTRSCPHCRSSVNQEANVFVNVQRLLVAAEQPPSNAAVADACQLHPSQQLSLYCTDCQAICCVDCTEADHRSHRLEALKVANEDMRKRYESLAENIETLNQLVRDYKIDVAKIESLRREGERRLADLHRRLQADVDFLQRRLKTSCAGLDYYMKFAPQLIASIESKMKEPACNRLIEEASRLDDLDRVVNDAMSEHCAPSTTIRIPDLLHVELPELCLCKSAALIVDINYHAETAGGREADSW